MRSLASGLDDGAGATWDEPTGEGDRLAAPQAMALVSLASIVLWVGVFSAIVWVV